MIKNYFSIAIRQFFRNKVFTIINVAGLAIGISASLVIYLIVQYEFSFEKFQANRDRIYRVVTNMHFPDQDFKNGGVPVPLPTAVREEIPEIEKSTAFLMNDLKVTIPGIGTAPKIFKRQEHILFADQEYFQMIPYKWLSGDPGDALNGPGKVVLTESRARSYFPYQDLTRAIGHFIQYDDTLSAEVTGIVRDLDAVTNFQFKEFISLETYASEIKNSHGGDQWGSVSSSFQYFVQLKPGTNPNKVNEQLAVIRDKNKDDAYLPTDHFLQPLEDIHFNSEFDALSGDQAHKPTLYGLLAVAAFLLLLGCINFINLTTAQAGQRAKEIGVRKTLGSSKVNLRMQFLSETFVLTMLATILSLAITPVILRMFSGFIPEGLTFDLTQSPEVWLFIIGLTLVVSIAAGLYPALILSRYKPVSVLKNISNSHTSAPRHLWLRKSLIVTQFLIAQFFIIATLIVGKQIRFALTKNMGFKKDAIVYFQSPYQYEDNQNRRLVLLDKLHQIPGIEKISLSGAPPASAGTNSTTMKFEEDGKDIETTVEVKNADTSYFGLYQIKIIAGRNLLPSDTLKEYVINETFAHFLGYDDPSQLIGKSLGRGNASIPIVGVIADINTKSMRRVIEPLAYCSRGNNHTVFHLALPANYQNTDDWKRTLESVQTAYHEVYPEADYKYQFFDEDIAAFYQKEQNIAKLLSWSAGLAIFISCLGLLGLVLFTTNQRVKEIGVRKVLGASAGQIVLLLSVDLLRLVVLAFVVAVPIAWWLMDTWLSNFAYRTQISITQFVLGGLFMMVLAVMTLSFQTIRAASANPVDSLRTE